MASERSPRPRKPARIDDASERFLIRGQPHSVRYFDSAPTEEPPPGALAVPARAGDGVFWLMPEPIRLARPE